jgi:hypothetical protein
MLYDVYCNTVLISKKENDGTLSVLYVELFIANKLCELKVYPQILIFINSGSQISDPGSSNTNNNAIQPDPDSVNPDPKHW